VNSDAAIPLPAASSDGQEFARKPEEKSHLPLDFETDHRAEARHRPDLSKTCKYFQDETAGLADEELFRGIQKGDREALAILFRRYARIVRTVAQRILHNGSEADDLVQEVFLFVFSKGILFDPSRGSVRSWLIQVAWHRAIDRRRHLASRHFYDSLQHEDQLESREAPTWVSFYEDSIEGALGRDTLRKIDAALSEDQRRVIRLYFFEGHTIQEIAVLLNQTPGNVRNHYYRALEKMRREIFLTKLLKK
jgi:RNA polymerase sigma-70 factor (ECF subfamily)